MLLYSIYWYANTCSKIFLLITVHWLPLPDEKPAAVNESVPSWRLLDCFFFNSRNVTHLKICLLPFWNWAHRCAALSFVLKLVVGSLVECCMRWRLGVFMMSSFLAFLSSCSRLIPLLCGSNPQKVILSGWMNVFNWGKDGFMDPVIIYDWLTLPDCEQMVVNETVFSWSLLVCSFFNSTINLQQCANCWVKWSVTALICQEIPSDMTDSLEEFSISWSGILKGVLAIRFLVSVLLSLLSVTISMFLFIS